MNTSQTAGNSKMNDRAYSRKEVVEIIRSALGRLDKTIDPGEKLFSELTTLATYIESMRADLAQLRSAEISGDHIPTATDELDAVVGETAKATGAIMDSCDLIEKLAEGLGAPVGPELSNAVTAIYEACSFQDITGQRITKVVKTLKHIEEKVSEILDALGHETGVESVDVAQKSEAESLLNGPQLTGKASTQEDIDALLASFD